jgi:DNA-binding HxlR family transcriptional regulator
MSIYEDVNLALKHIDLSQNKTLLIKIVKCVEKYNLLGGIRVSKLAKDLEIDPSTVTRNCKRLEELDWITRENKQTPYHITPKGHQIRIIFAMMYERKSKIWKANVPIAMILKDGKRVIQNKFWDFDKILKFRYDDTRIEFLSFANEIGATIIYLFLQAIKPDNKIKATGKDRDQMIKNWLRSMIDLEAIFSKFCELLPIKEGRAVWTEPSYNEQARDAVVKRIKGNSELSVEEKQKEITRANRDLEIIKEVYSKRRRASPDTSKYELDINNSEKLFRMYKEIFPVVFTKISKYAEELREEYREAFTRS